MTRERAATPNELWGRLLSRNAGDRTPREPCSKSDHIPLAGINSICSAHGVIWLRRQTKP